MIAAPAAVLRRSAEVFAAQGWHVLPTAGKVPRTEHGVNDASADPAVIAHWWNRWPTADIGVACGPSGLIVVDLDGPDATAVWQDLARGHDLAPTRTARTGRLDGGWHLYYRDPPTSAGGTADQAGAATFADGTVPDSAGRVRNSAGQLAPGIDIRADGGYVIAPPSLHESGAALYTWHVPAGACRPLPVSDAPEWLIDTLTTPDAPGISGPAAVTTGAGEPLARPAVSQRYLDAAVRGEADRVAAASEGTRNHTLNRAAFALAGLGVPEAVIRERLARAADSAGLDAREIDRTLTSAIGAGYLHPRQAVTLTRPAAAPTEAATAGPSPAPRRPQDTTALQDTTADPDLTSGAEMSSTPTTGPARPDPVTRRPYVGVGADGARQSAQIDREEADTLPLDNPRRVELLASADRWDLQAGAATNDPGAADAEVTDPQVTDPQVTNPEVTGPTDPASESADLRAWAAGNEEIWAAQGRIPATTTSVETVDPPAPSTSSTAGAHPGEELRAWATRTGQGATLPVAQAAKFGRTSTPVKQATSATAPGSSIGIPRQGSSAGDQALTWHRTADRLTSLAQREADPQRAAATREHADVARRISTAMGREHVAHVTSPTRGSHDRAGDNPAWHDGYGPLGAGPRPSSARLERTAGVPSPSSLLEDASGFAAAAHPDADQTWRTQAIGHDGYGDAGGDSGAGW